jgi:hypothetical protein
VIGDGKKMEVEFGMCFLKVRKNVEYWGFEVCVEVMKVKSEHVLAWWNSLCACEAIYRLVFLVMDSCV